MDKFEFDEKIGFYDFKNKEFNDFFKKNFIVNKSDVYDVFGKRELNSKDFGYDKTDDFATSENVFKLLQDAYLDGNGEQVENFFRKLDILAKDLVANEEIENRNENYIDGNIQNPENINGFELNGIGKEFYNEENIEVAGRNVNIPIYESKSGLSGDSAAELFGKNADISRINFNNVVQMLNSLDVNEIYDIMNTNTESFNEIRLQRYKDFHKITENEKEYEKDKKRLEIQSLQSFYNGNSYIFSERFFDEFAKDVLIHGYSETLKSYLTPMFVGPKYFLTGSGSIFETYRQMKKNLYDRKVRKKIELESGYKVEYNTFKRMIQRDITREEFQETIELDKQRKNQKFKDLSVYAYLENVDYDDYDDLVMNELDKMMNKEHLFLKSNEELKGIYKNPEKLFSKLEHDYNKYFTKNKNDFVLNEKYQNLVKTKILNSITRRNIKKSDFFIRILDRSSKFYNLTIPLLSNGKPTMKDIEQNFSFFSKEDKKILLEEIEKQLKESTIYIKPVFELEGDFGNSDDVEENIEKIMNYMNEEMELEIDYETLEKVIRNSLTINASKFGQSIFFDKQEIEFSTKLDFNIFSTLLQSEEIPQEQKDKAIMFFFKNKLNQTKISERGILQANTTLMFKEVYERIAKNKKQKKHIDKATVKFFEKFPFASKVGKTISRGVEKNLSPEEIYAQCKTQLNPLVEYLKDSESDAEEKVKKVFYDTVYSIYELTQDPDVTKKIKNRKNQNIDLKDEERENEKQSNEEKENNTPFDGEYDYSSYENYEPNDEDYPDNIYPDDDYANYNDYVDDSWLNFIPNEEKETENNFDFEEEKKENNNSGTSGNQGNLEEKKSNPFLEEYNENDLEEKFYNKFINTEKEEQKIEISKEFFKELLKDNEDDFLIEDIEDFKENGINDTKLKEILKNHENKLASVLRNKGEKYEKAFGKYLNIVKENIYESEKKQTKKERDMDDVFDSVIKGNPEIKVLDDFVASPEQIQKYMFLANEPQETKEVIENNVKANVLYNQLESNAILKNVLKNFNAKLLRKNAENAEIFEDTLRNSYLIVRKNPNGKSFDFLLKNIDDNKSLINFEMNIDESLKSDERKDLIDKLNDFQNLPLNEKNYIMSEVFNAATISEISDIVVKKVKQEKQKNKENIFKNIKENTFEMNNNIKLKTNEFGKNNLSKKIGKDTEILVSLFGKNNFIFKDKNLNLKENDLKKLNEFSKIFIEMIKNSNTTDNFEDIKQKAFSKANLGNEGKFFINEILKNDNQTNNKIKEKNDNLKNEKNIQIQNKELEEKIQKNEKINKNSLEDLKKTLNEMEQHENKVKNSYVSEFSDESKLNKLNKIKISEENTKAERKIIEEQAKEETETISNLNKSEFEKEALEDKQKIAELEKTVEDSIENSKEIEKKLQKDTENVFYIIQEIKEQEKFEEIEEEETKEEKEKENESEINKEEQDKKDKDEIQKEEKTEIVKKIRNVKATIGGR